MRSVSDVRFEDATQTAGLDFVQHFGGCGEHYFIEQVASGATVIDANNDGNMDIYFPAPTALGPCKIPADAKQRLYLNDGKAHFTLAENAFGSSKTDYGLAASTGDSPVSQASVITLSSWSCRRLCAIGTRSSAVRLSFSSSVASSKLT